MKIVRIDSRASCAKGRTFLHEHGLSIYSRKYLDGTRPFDHDVVIAAIKDL